MGKLLPQGSCNSGKHKQWRREIEWGVQKKLSDEPYFKHPLDDCQNPGGTVLSLSHEKVSLCDRNLLIEDFAM